MIATFAAIWLKLNLLLLVAFALWRASKWLSASCGQALRFNVELKLARCLFTATLLAPLMFGLSGSLADLSGQVPGLTVFADNLSAGIDGGLARTLAVSNAELSVAMIFVALLSAGLLLQLLQLSRRYRQLEQLLALSTPFRRLHGVHIVFSSEVATPFSTGAVGINHIVLPYQLLQSPANLRLALKHELQHIRSGDLRWVLFLEFLKPLFFWNPAWYLWLNEFHCLQEYACDEALLRKPSVHAHEYGNCLLEVASHATRAPVWAASNMVPQFAPFRSAHSQLKRRILMLERIRSDKYNGVRAGGHACVLMVGIMLSTAGLVAQEQEELTYLPLTVVQPAYPQQALDEELIGWTQVMFDVDVDGGVSRIAVRDHCVVPAAFDASLVTDERGCLSDSGTFDAASIAAMEKFTFNPRIVEGDAVVTPDVQYVFRFSLQSGATPAREIQEQYRALRNQ